MRKSALAGLFAFVAIFATGSSSKVSAESLDILIMKNTDQRMLGIGLVDIIEQKSKVKVKSGVKIHSVGPNENLSTIAKQHNTPWIRLFYRNEQIAYPDLIKEGDQVIIPLPAEALKERPLPEPLIAEPAFIPSPAPQKPVATSPTARTRTKYASVASPVSRGSVAGNTYSRGYCTWYAKNMRPDLPNNLGNANSWVSRAAAQGMATGSTPRPGAIGQQGMHVVYVQNVNSDGTVTISEMNYKGLYVVSTRTLPASTFRYIY